MEPHVDHDLLYRPKRGFSMPLRRWFREALRPRLEAMASSPRLLDSGLFNPDTLRDLVHEHVSGRNDHAAALWLLLMFDAFLAHESERDGA